MRNPVGISDKPADICTGYSPNSPVNRYRYTVLFSVMMVFVGLEQKRTQTVVHRLCTSVYMCVSAKQEGRK
jgi:hypothetical protein